MRIRSTHLTVALVAFASFVLAACGGTATGIVDVRVTDAPDPAITAIVITADNFRVNKASDGEDGEGEWITLLEGEHTFDLLKVVAKEESLGLNELEVGTYNQVRMDIQEVLITRDGVEETARVPSSVLRIVRPFEVVEGETTVLTFDFDAEKSVVEAGPNLQLKPVVKLLVRRGDEPFIPEVDLVVPTPTPDATPTPTPEPGEFVLHIEEPIAAETISEVPSVTVRGRTRVDAAISINDLFLTPDEEGIFTADLTLVEGPNVIEVIASIESGEELSEILTVIYLP